MKRVGAKRVVLDSIDTLFAGIPNEAILRSELRRLFTWLKERELTTVITAERGEKSLTRHGIEEYVSDCVIVLDHRVMDDLSTRRLRVVKYRGTSHGTNEYPFLIDEHGITVLPITSLGLRHGASEERLSTGLAELDAMLAGKGYFEGSSIFADWRTRHRQDNDRRAFRGCDVPSWRAVPLFQLRGKPQPARAQHALGRDRFAALDRQRAFAMSRLAPSLGGSRCILALMLKAIQDFSPSGCDR